MASLIRNTLFVMTCAFLGACGGGSSGSEVASTAPPVPVLPSPFANMKILVLGQSISSNCNEYIYGPVQNVFQIGLDGDTKPARDPFEWADCVGGSMWMPLGKRMVESGVASQVTFMPIGVGATSVRDWQAGGRAYEKLNAAIALIKKQGVRFDYAFWHQGTSDNGLGESEYLTRLSAVVDYVDSNVSIDRWLIAMHSRCFGAHDLNIEMAQRKFGNVPALRRYPGPNMNLLGNEFRLPDACHLNQRGQEEMASMWLESVKKSLK